MIIVDTYTEEYQIGGKARNLFLLKAQRINIPEFVVLPAENLQEIIDGSNTLDEITQRIDSYKFTEVYFKRISVLTENGTVAVRSSAIDEDGSSHSFAGQFESILHVTKDTIVESIKHVWKSAFSERVIEYRKHNGLENQVSIAVIIQRMVDADLAGVAFGLNPVTGDRSEKVISAVWGLGEGLVSGDLNADTFVLKADGSITSDLAVKDKKITRNTESVGFTVLEKVDEIYHSAPTLDEKKLKEIGSVLNKLFIYFKAYQDIEFAYLNDTFYLLQSRPITSHATFSDKSGEYIIWDNSNIIESYPGVTTPLTFSFILPVYEAVYRQFAAMMGVKEKDIDKNRGVFANMLGLINGRVYYNLLSWYRALALLPGYKLNAEFMEKMMGVKERFVLEEGEKTSKFSERMRVLRLLRIMIGNLRSLPKMRKTFVEDFNAKMEYYEKIDFSSKNAFQIMKLYDEFEQTLLKKWKAPLVNDFFAMIYFGVLQKLVIKYKIDEGGTIHNDLISGANDIISTEPIERCTRIAYLIEKDQEAKELFLRNSPENIYLNIHSLSSEIQSDINAYLAKFGNRCVGELKLETITYTQRPESFIKIIKSYVEQGIGSRSGKSDYSSEIRNQAEEKVHRTLQTKPFKKMIFNYFLKRARILVSSRENLRFERTRGFGMIRKMFCAIGDLFYAEQIIETPSDIFYLTKQEIFDHIKGTSVNPDLKKLISLRKEEFKKFETQATTERIPTYGVVYLGNDFYSSSMNSIIDGDLKGIACCPGIVRAKVQVIHSPEEVENLNGDILVTSSTDPGWVTLFPTASAILVERGSLLSHSAIVSREMGKPCIVGITGLLQTLKTGDLVEMDGGTGEIKILKS